MRFLRARSLGTARDCEAIEHGTRRRGVPLRRLLVRNDFALGVVRTELTADNVLIMTQHTPSHGHTHAVEPVDAELYPVFLKLGGRKVLVVGGGAVARSKLEALVAAQAIVTVVAPEILPEIEQLGVTCVRRSFCASDLDGSWYVVAAAPPAINREVEQACSIRQLFVNAVDDAQHASSYLGGVVRKGGVTLAISTGGRSPALAGMLRAALEAIIPDEIAEWVSAGESARKQWIDRQVPLAERRPLLLRVLNRLYADATPGVERAIAEQSESELVGREPRPASREK
jgi:siroheme synthase-like protein